MAVKRPFKPTTTDNSFDKPEQLFESAPNKLGTNNQNFISKSWSTENNEETLDKSKNFFF